MLRNPKDDTIKNLNAMAQKTRYDLNRTIVPSGIVEPLYPTEANPAFAMIPQITSDPKYELALGGYVDAMYGSARKIEPSREIHFRMTRARRFHTHAGQEPAKPTLVLIGLAQEGNTVFVQDKGAFRTAETIRHMNKLHISAKVEFKLQKGALETLQGINAENQELKQRREEPILFDRMIVREPGPGWNRSYMEALAQKMMECLNFEDGKTPRVLIGTQQSIPQEARHTGNSEQAPGEPIRFLDVFKQVFQRNHLEVTERSVHNVGGRKPGTDPVQRENAELLRIKKPEQPKQLPSP